MHTESAPTPAVTANSFDGVRLSLPEGGRSLPLVIEAMEAGTPLAPWLQRHHAEVMAARQRHGALLLRGFGVEQAQDFEDAARVIAPDLKDRYLGTSPRNNLSSHVFTSTELPPHYPIPQHAEMSFYYDRAPHSLFFWCPRPAATGGATPVTDLRRVWANLDPQVRARFEGRRLRHIRAYKSPRARFNFDVFQFKRWNEIYGTTDRAQVEAIAAETGDELFWDGNDRLRLHSTHPVTRDHPETGERVWFNHLQVMHLSATPYELARQGRLLGRPRLRLLAAYLGLIAGARRRLRRPEQQSWHVTWDDGGEVRPADVRHVCDTIWRETTVMPWQRGDVLAIDNRSVAHGRTPFTGDRLVAVAWA